jgi:hypothetical protein
MTALGYLRTERRRRDREWRGYRRPESVVDDALGPALQDFTLTLTPREREYLEGVLLLDEPAAPMTLSRANRWQLEHRIRVRLRAFLRADDESMPNDRPRPETVSGSARGR